jgi:type I restriction enzyme M protein
MLKKGGRSATIVPDGVLFGSSKAHVELRKMLVKEHQLEAVFSLPSGVFKPYAGVSTAIVVFTKGGKTDHVFFYDVEADGYSLDDKRDAIKDNDLPDALKRWTKRSAKKDSDRTAKHFMVPVKEIEEKAFDLSINRYKETKHEEVVHEPPKVILAKLRQLEAEIAKDLDELEAML